VNGSKISDSRFITGDTAVKPIQWLRAAKSRGLLRL